LILLNLNDEVGNMKRNLLLALGLCCSLIACPVWAGSPYDQSQTSATQGFDTPTQQTPQQYAPVDQGYGKSSPVEQTGSYGTIVPQWPDATTVAGDMALRTLLTMVLTDLNMCRYSIRGNYLETVLAIGHLNNARSALGRSGINPRWYPLASEIDNRLSRIKFHLVMRDIRNADMMLQQLIGAMQMMLQGNSRNAGSYGITSTPGTTVFYVPTGVPVIYLPMMPSMPTTTDWGQGQSLNPRGVPSTLVPVSDGY
jgi:hypothetical protein